MRLSPSPLRLSCPCALLLLAGCAGSADDTGPVGEEGPVFALMSQVYSVDDRTVYVALTDTVDVDAIELDDAREFPGVANFAPVGGRLLVSDGEQPIITAFSITPDLGWEEGPTVSFASYPLDDNANIYYHFVRDEHTAYLPFETSKRIVWDPTEMVISGTVEDSSLTMESDGMQLYAGGNRNAVRFGGPVLQAFFYVSDDWSEYGPSSQIAAYDPETHAETTVLDAPCPALSIATQDEAGNTFFGTWGYLGIRALYGEGPAPCAVRVTPDLAVDDDWTTDFTAWTGGRYVNNFRYVGNGKAIGNVLHHEELDADFDGPFDPAVEEAAWASGPHWRFWIFDLEAEEAHPVEGIDVDIGSGAQFAVFDDRTFVFLPFDSWGRTKIYELDDQGNATEHLEVVGDVFKWERLR